MSRGMKDGGLRVRSGDSQDATKQKLLAAIEQRDWAVARSEVWATEIGKLRQELAILKGMLK